MDEVGPRPRFAMDRCGAGERQQAETIVASALAGRDSSETWMVALQRFHGGWDVFVEGPDPATVAQMKEAFRKSGFIR
jgi:hypothetical protein